MNDRTSQVKNSIIAFADQITVSAGTFLSVLLVSRNCSEAEMGVFSLAWTIVAFVRTVQERAIAAPFLAFTYSPGFDRPTFRGSTLVHQSCFALFCSTVIALAATVAWILDSFQGQLLFGLSLAFALFLNLARDQMRAVSYTDFAVIRLWALDIAVVASQLLVLVTLSWMKLFSLTNANLALGFGCALPVLVWLVRIRHSFRIDHATVVSDWFHNWHYSRWLVAARVLGTAPIVAVPWLILCFEGKEGTGAYAVCTSLVGVSLMFVTGINNLFQPRTVLEFQRNGVRGMLTTIAESIGLIGFVLICISVTFWFYGGQLLTIFGPQYTKYGFVAFLLSLSTLSVSVSTLLANGLAALKKSTGFFWGEFCYCIVTISFAATLIPMQGLAGAAVSMILGGLGATVVTAVMLSREIANVERTQRASVLKSTVLMDDRSIS